VSRAIPTSYSLGAVAERPNAMNALRSALSAIEGEQADALVRAKVKGLLIGYHERWKDVEWETLSVEEEYELPLVNPETGRTSRTFRHAGKFDGIIRYKPSGKIYLLEHKSSSEEIADPAAVFWKRRKIDSQVSHYVLANLQLGILLDGTVCDVIRKPGIRPKEIVGEPFRTLVQQGIYYGFPVPDKTRRLLKQEDEELYSLRLARECIKNADRYFQRRAEPRLNSETLSYAGELWDIGQSILEIRRTGRRIKNSDACLMYGTPCQYLGICCGEDTLESDRWERIDTIHEELPTIQSDGRNVLTNSRNRCLKSCEMKHHLRYELGVRRRDEEEREALAFGHLIHLGLAAWWLAFKKEPEDVNNANGNTASEVVRPAAGLERDNQQQGQEPPF
jgi:hypothetical protein